MPGELGRHSLLAAREHLVAVWSLARNGRQGEAGWPAGGKDGDGPPSPVAMLHSRWTVVSRSYGPVGMLLQLRPHARSDVMDWPRTAATEVEVEVEVQRDSARGQTANLS